MALEFRLPDIGEGVVEGEVVQWMVQEGDQIREDQPMVEVMTDKATVEIPSPRSGRVAKILAPAGKLCAVGQVMLVIEEAGDRPAAASAHGAPPSQATVAVQAAPAAPAASAALAGKVLATPATRKLARDLGVPIGGLRGTGPGGRVTKDDVRHAHGGAHGHEPIPTRTKLPKLEPAPAHAGSAPGPAARIEQAAAIAPLLPLAGDERVPFRGVRKKIADNMSRSKREAAHFTYVEECDVTELSALRQRAKKRAEERGLKLSFLPFIIKAVVAGLKKYPILNSTLDAEAQEIVLRRRYHVGVATATEAGLIVPVVRDADQLSLFQIGERLQQLSDKVRTGKQGREDVTGSTFTISSLGALGGVLATPIINHPEVAILGVHKMQDAAVVREGQIVIRTMMNLSISLDHRIVDGYEGAQFLQHVIALLQDPTLMFMEMV